MKRKFSPILFFIMAASALSLPACSSMKAEDGEPHHPAHRIVATHPLVKDVITVQPYVCQIHSKRHTEIKALEEGYLEAIEVHEGQTVTEGQVMFTVMPPIYKARLESEKADARFAAIKLKNTKILFEKKVVSDQEVALYEAELARAEARVARAEAEFKFTMIKAPFTGIMDRQLQQQGSLVKKDEILTTLSDNTLMWVYFNVPEARYLEYKRESQARSVNLSEMGFWKWIADVWGYMDVSKLTFPNSKIELKLANGKIYPLDAGDTVTVEANFNNLTGNIPFRADFLNPDLVLRHGQTGTVLVHHTVHNAILIPQKATFEFLDKQYVWVVGADHIVHRRLITVRDEEVEDAFIITSGLSDKDVIIVEGVQQVHDGDKIEFELETPQKMLSHQKNPAE